MGLVKTIQHKHGKINIRNESIPTDPVEYKKSVFDFYETMNQIANNLPQKDAELIFYKDDQLKKIKSKDYEFI